MAANSVNLSNLDGNNGFRMFGGGSIVSKASDVNGDGFDDLIAGASSFVVFGKATGFSAQLNSVDL